MKISSIKGLLHKSKKKKLSLRYIGPFKISAKIGPVSYELLLPSEFGKLHNVFHVSQLRKCIEDHTEVIPHEHLNLKDNATLEVHPIKIFDFSLKTFRRKQMPLVKIRWQGPQLEEETWELESEMRDKYPYLFGKYVHSANAFIR